MFKRPETLGLRVAPYPELSGIEAAIEGTFTHPSKVVLDKFNRRVMRNSPDTRLREIQSTVAPSGRVAGIYEARYNTSFLLEGLDPVDQFSTAQHEAGHALRSFFLGYRDIYDLRDHPDLNQTGPSNLSRMATQIYDEGFAKWVDHHSAYKVSERVLGRDALAMHETSLEQEFAIAQKQLYTFPELMERHLGHKLVHDLMRFLMPRFGTFESLRIVAISEPESWEQAKGVLLNGNFPTFLQIPNITRQ